MNIADYKKIFENLSERAWLSDTLQNIVKSTKYHEIVAYLSGEKDISLADDMEELYKIKSTFFELGIDCKIILDSIGKLSLDFQDEFDNGKTVTSKIEINAGDKFVCINDFLLWDMIQVNQGTIIEVTKFNYTDAFHLECDLVKLETDKKTQELFPDQRDIQLLFMFCEFTNSFQKL